MAQSSSRPERTTVAVIGLGSIGGVIGGCLRDADRHDVVVCIREPVEQLVVERPEGMVQVDLRALSDPAEAQRVDWVLLCTKAHHTPSTAPWLSRLCDSSTRVAVLQNGIEHAARVGPLVGGATVVSTVVYYSGERLAKDRVRLRHVADFDLAVADDEDGRAFAQLLDGTPLRVLLSTDFATFAWRKLLINVVANPITALTLQRQAVLRRDDVHALCLAVLKEAVAVACADGARLPAAQPAQTMAALQALPPDTGTSMYFDRLAGRSLEVEALTGAIVAVGQRLGMPTPLNGMLLTLLRAINAANGAA
jgi:2-dehydropantoate 2-reductase